MKKIHPRPTLISNSEKSCIKHCKSGLANLSIVKPISAHDLNSKLQSKFEKHSPLSPSSISLNSPTSTKASPEKMNQKSHVHPNSQQNKGKPLPNSHSIADFNLKDVNSESLNTVQSETHTNEPINEAKNHKELASDLKKCIEELKTEADLYLKSGMRKIQSTGLHPKKIILDTSENIESMFENESKDSALVTSPTPCKIVSYKNKTQKITANDLSGIKKKAEKCTAETIFQDTALFDIEFKMQMLIDKMKRSEIEAQNNMMENLKLKENIMDLETKIENLKDFQETSKVSCSNKCVIY